MTGAGGFVGRALCSDLVQRGHSVVAAIRTRDLPSETLVERLRIESIGHLSTRPTALHGIDCVVHLAARVHRMNEDQSRARALYFAENADATVSLAEAAASVGVSRFVFLSSIKAISGSAASDPLGPSARPAPEDAYGESKLAAERGLQDLAERKRIGIAIVRSPLVFGPGVAANFRALVEMVRRGIPLPFASVRNRRSIVSVWNLADFLSVCAERESRGTTLLHVSDAEPVSTPDLVRLIAEALDRRPLLFPMSPRALEGILRALGRGPLVDRLLRSLELEVSESFGVLNWRPRVSTRDAISMTVRNS